MVDKSWFPIMNLIYQDPLLTLRTKVLPEISYQPKNKVFDVFSMPMKDIRVVILRQEPYSIPIKVKDIEYLKEQGVLFLNVALTVETGKSGSHLQYWEDFTKRVVSHIAMYSPCIWIMVGRKAQSFVPYIKNPFNTKDYSKITLEKIPINSDWNYIIPTKTSMKIGDANDCFHYANRVLQKKRMPTIDW